MNNSHSRTLISLVKQIYFIYSGGLWGVWLLIMTKVLMHGDQFGLTSSFKFAYQYEFIFGTFTSFISSTIFVITFLLISLNRQVDPVVLTITACAYFLMFSTSASWATYLGFYSDMTYMIILLVGIALLLNIILFKKVKVKKKA